MFTSVIYMSTSTYVDLISTVCIDVFVSVQKDILNSEIEKSENKELINNKIVLQSDWASLFGNFLISVDNWRTWLILDSQKA